MRNAHLISHLAVVTSQTTAVIPICKQNHVGDQLKAFLGSRKQMLIGFALNQNGSKVTPGEIKMLFSRFVQDLLKRFGNFFTTHWLPSLELRQFFSGSDEDFSFQDFLGSYLTIQSLFMHFYRITNFSGLFSQTLHV